MDIDHYRPKVPYWWLAYNYQNYYLTCSECNRYHKKEQFPIYNSSRAIYETRKNLNEEMPLLINPIEENPLGHFCLYFQTKRGQKTVLLKPHPDLMKLPDTDYQRQKAENTIRIFNLDWSQRNTNDGNHFSYFQELYRGLRHLVKHYEKQNPEKKSLTSSEQDGIWKSFLDVNPTFHTFKTGYIEMILRGNYIVKI